ncbi:Ig-like domain-containing protein [Jejuia pallidilutea]|uniref:Glycosyl hydrolase family 16 n=1 Tax=Jejuia pallidilutea TaxID=504487 RepID=A0A098LRR0_9FLAO|nr:Ig-like domain-containing protein [Jejuia pallidilutea]PQV49603.1 Ig-like protein group 2 [Jejuia pallidilutea]GAL89067.1 glycosyl hydrolase family 16 [Jejuia pallidilutea]
MKNIKLTYTKMTILLGCIFITIASCERELSDEAVFATFPTAPEVFNDSPVGLGTDFYFPYINSKATAWSVDEKESYEGSASMRFDVPNANDPEGSFAGAIFRIDGEGSGRNLTDYDALTFWAKATQSVTIGEIGFGEDFGENKYVVGRKAIDLTTAWKKYIIPIPDPSKLIQERGLLRYSTGSLLGSGYTFWLDEVRYEKLGTLAQPKPKILNGVDVEETTFIGTQINLSERGLTQTFNLPNGVNQEVTAAPSYFTFESSNPEVAIVNELGVVTVLDAGSATITATIAGVKAAGSLTLQSLGNFAEAPVPTRDPANVISIFSDAYTNVPVDYYNGFFTPDGQTTQGGEPPLTLGSGQVINYTQLNFVGIGTFLNVSSIDASQMTHLHVDINVQEAVESGDYITLQLLNSVGNNETSGSVRITDNQLQSNQWVSLDVPLNDFGLANRDKLGLLFFISDNTISNIYVDNIYYYKE